MKVAIIATECKGVEDMLVALAVGDGFEAITIKPEEAELLAKLRRISYLPKVCEVRIHADRSIADYAENTKTFFTFKVDILPIERCS